MNLPKLNLIHKYGKDWEAHIDELYIGIPKGWISCQGQRISEKQYPELFEMLGESYGKTEIINGTPTIPVPDFRATFSRSGAHTIVQNRSCFMFIMKVESTKGVIDAPVGTITEFVLKRRY